MHHNHHHHFKKREIPQNGFIQKLLKAKGSIVQDEGKCVYCGVCQKNCPADALSVSKADKTWTIDHSQCVRCKHCVKSCPTGALSLQKK